MYYIICNLLLSVHIRIWVANTDTPNIYRITKIYIYYIFCIYIYILIKYCMYILMHIYL